MVKITNPLGNIKVGRQGEAVYQRKYGEQIRRTASPKRAIPSQRQIEHRQLYRAALDWRSQLSLPNRRYLDGYCIANGIVDSYHIPLPWSRFALKIYLQAVKFVSITKPIAGEVTEEQLYENYQYVLPGYSKIWGNARAAQTFTPLVTHKLTKVGLYLSHKAVVGLSHIQLHPTDAQGHPTAEVLSAISFPATELPTGDPSAFFYKDMPEYEVLAGVKYAWWLRQDGGGANYYMMAGRHSPGATYPRGNTEWSTDGGSSWTAYPDIDYYFEEYGIAAGVAPEPGLLHVRHPALLKVVHKRGELTINGYDTLSSLDEEYLTKQVGLDVEVGDLIKATTLPGIDYAYPIL